MNYNNNINQDIKERFVNREVITNMNQMIQFLFNSENKQEWEEEINNISAQPDYESAAEYEGWYLDKEVGQWINDSDGNEEIQYDTVQDVCENENIDYDYIEAYEFWSVSDYLGNKLKERGEMVQDILGHTIWGRCTTGQAILLDHCISEVCEDLEILEGQANSWAK